MINYLYFRTRKENFIFTIVIDVAINIHTDNHFFPILFPSSIHLIQVNRIRNKLINISQTYIIKQLFLKDYYIKPRNIPSRGPAPILHSAFF